jgi:hypothetical protein
VLDADWDFASAQLQSGQHHVIFKEIFTSVVEGELVRKATDEEHYEKFIDLWKDASLERRMRGREILKRKNIFF